MIDVETEDPLARIIEITGGEGVDVALDCTAGAGTCPTLLGIEALKRKGGTLLIQGEDGGISRTSRSAKVANKYITIKAARGHNYQSLRAGAETTALDPLPAGPDHHPPLRAEGHRCRDQGGRRQRRGDTRLAAALGVSGADAGRGRSGW